MATIKWINGRIASYLYGANWAGGRAPGAGDTAVISSAGDAAPVAADGLLTPAPGSSEAFLSLLKQYSRTLQMFTEGNGRTEYYYTTPAPGQVPAGETITTPSIDLIGAGSEAELSLQNSKIAANVNTSISGDAYVYAGYTNVLAGRIYIGYPLTVNGQVQPTPPLDKFGLRSALYLSIRVFGSWTDGGALSGYVPGVDNTGTIYINAGSGLVSFIGGGTGGLTNNGNNTDTYTAPNISRLENAGTIRVGSGGLFETETYGTGMFVNNGAVDLVGAGGRATSAYFATTVTGTGTFNLSGGTQTDPAKTLAEFVNRESGQSFTIGDAAVLLNPGGQNANFSGLTYTGGTVAFTGTGILQIDAPAALSVGQMFNDQITGLRAGDYLSLDYYLKNYATSWTPTLVWNQAQHTLQLYDVTRSPSGTQSALQASFTLAGTYQSNSFHLANVSWNGQALSPVFLSIYTTTTAPGADPSGSAVASIGSTDLNLAVAAHPAFIGSPGGTASPEAGIDVPAGGLSARDAGFDLGGHEAVPPTRETFHGSHDPAIPHPDMLILSHPLF